MERVPFTSLLNNTFSKVEHTEGIDQEEVRFYDMTGRLAYRLYHEQDCCEGSWLEEIHGDLTDLLDNPILHAEEVSSEEDPPASAKIPSDCGGGWTFYKLSTIKGSVTLRWFGYSNGYYAIDAALYKENYK